MYLIEEMTCLISNNELSMGVRHHKSCIKLVRHRRGVKLEDFETVLDSMIVQREALNTDWPLTAFGEIDGNEQPD